MATITFRYRSTKDFAPFTLRLEHKTKRYNAPTKVYVEKDFFDNYYSQYLKLTNKQIEKRNDPNFKENYPKFLEYNEKLNPLKRYVLSSLAEIPDEEYSTQLIKNIVKQYYNSDEQQPERLNVTYWIEYKIKNHAQFKNGKGGKGLSENTLKNINTFLNNIHFYESEGLGRKMKLSDLTQDGIDAYDTFLVDWSYIRIYKRNLISDLISFGKVARVKGKMSLPSEFDAIEIPMDADIDEKEEDVIYLSQEELDKIQNLKLDKPYLINARKWLLLGCYTGQRGGDLLNKVLDNVNLKDSTISISQEKTPVKVVIPMHPIVKEILSDPPHKISLQKCADYFKEIGKLANIKKMVKDYRRELIKEKKLKDGGVKKLFRGVLKNRPKYSYIGTHTCRRTFCMLYHGGEMQNSDIMKVTGHKKESTFLTYINKTDDSHVKRWQEHFEKNINVINMMFIILSLAM